MLFLKFIIFIVVFLFCMVSITLYANDANMFDEPGFGNRLSIFFGTNVAVTADDHEFKELRPPVYQKSADVLYQELLLAASGLGWEIVSHDSDTLKIGMVVRSRVFLFADDVLVQVKALSDDTSTLHAESRSRVGSGDLGANSGHIQALMNSIQ